MPRLPRYLPHQCLPRALPDRRATLHFLSDHREQGSGAAPVPPRHGQPQSMAATIAWPPARGTKYAVAAREAKLVARDDLVSPPLAAFLKLDERGISDILLRLSRQAHRPRPVFAQCADRRRQQRRSRAGTLSARRCCRIRRPWWRGAAVWALSNLTGANYMRGLEARTADEPDEHVREEWRMAVSPAG